MKIFRGMAKAYVWSAPGGCAPNQCFGEASGNVQALRVSCSLVTCQLTFMRTSLTRLEKNVIQQALLINDDALLWQTIRFLVEEHTFNAAFLYNCQRPVDPESVSQIEKFLEGVLPIVPGSLVSIKEEGEVWAQLDQIRGEIAKDAPLQHMWDDIPEPDPAFDFVLVRFNSYVDLYYPGIDKGKIFDAMKKTGGGNFAAWIYSREIKRH
jgi:hypothetical protein